MENKREESPSKMQKKVRFLDDYKEGEESHPLHVVHIIEDQPPEFPVNASISSFDIEEAAKHLEEAIVLVKPKTFYDTFFGIIMMLISVVFFALSTVFWKLAYMQNEKLTGFDYLIVRSATLVFASLIQAGYLRVNLLDIKPEGRFWLFVRCFCGAIFFPWFYVSLKFLPSSKATLISNIYPLLVTIVAYYFLRETITHFDIIAVIGAFIGVLVMNLTKTDSSKIDTSNELVIIGVVLWAFTALLGTGVTISIKLMNKHLHYLMNPSYFAFTLFVMSLVLLAVYPTIYNFEYYRLSDMGWFILSGIVHYTAQTLASVAYKYEDASKLAPLNYTIGVFLFFSDMFLFGYSFSFTDIIGIVLVIAFLMMPILHKVYMINNPK